MSYPAVGRLLQRPDEGAHGKAAVLRGIAGTEQAKVKVFTAPMGQLEWYNTCR